MLESALAIEQELAAKATTFTRVENLSCKRSNNAKVKETLSNA
jgi:hypothetical protein